MHGTVARPISFAAMTRPWPAMITPSESIRIDQNRVRKAEFVHARDDLRDLRRRVGASVFCVWNQRVNGRLLDRRRDDRIHENPSFDPPSSFAGEKTYRHTRSLDAPDHFR